MSQRRTNRGQIIDFDALRNTQGDKPAVGNMHTDGNGNVLGPGGEVLQTNEQRVRQYLKDNPTVSNDKVSLKSDEPMSQMQNDNNNFVETKTAKTAQENVRTKVQPDPVTQPSESEIMQADLEPIPTQKEPLGYKEVQLPNGDIDMVPYYTQDDAPDGQT